MLIYVVAVSCVLYVLFRWFTLATPSIETWVLFIFYVLSCLLISMFKSHWGIVGLIPRHCGTDSSLTEALWDWYRGIMGLIQVSPRHCGIDTEALWDWLKSHWGIVGLIPRHCGIDSSLTEALWDWYRGTVGLIQVSLRHCGIDTEALWDWFKSHWGIVGLIPVELCCCANSLHAVAVPMSQYLRQLLCWSCVTRQ